MSVKATNVTYPNSASVFRLFHDYFYNSVFLKQPPVNFGKFHLKWKNLPIASSKVKP